MGFRFVLDVNALAKELADFEQEIQDEVRLATARSAEATYIKAQELATERLKTTKTDFVNNLKYEEIADGIWVCSLLKPMVWRDEGLSPFDMRQTLLKSPKAKMGKHGRYLHVPFQHSKEPSKQADQAKRYTNQIRKELKARNIPYTKIERHASGDAKLGKLHSFSIASDYPTRKSGISVASHQALQGVTIYQREVKDAGGNRVMDKDGKPLIKRDIMTFRTISEGTALEKWQYPGLEGAHIMDDAFAWIQETFETQVLPQIFEKYGA